MKTRIVCLDGYTLNPGDLDWACFERLGALTVHPRTSPQELIERASGASILLTNKTVLNAQALAQLPELKYIGVLATGYNVVDVQAAARHGITITNVPDYSTDSVAQHAMALILELARRVGEHDQAVKKDRWAQGPDFSFTLGPILDLTDLTLGIVGCGRIGQALAKIACAMGMKLLAYSPSGPKPTPGLAIRWVGLRTLLEESDVVSLHCPLTPETRHLINQETLAWMKPEAWLINTGRGPLIDETALANALNGNRLGGAALDVLSDEPPASNHRLTQTRRCIITPHIAWASLQARRRLMQMAAENLAAFLQNQPIHVVTPR